MTDEEIKLRLATLSLTVSFMIMAITPAYAYLDPGTGSMILQGLIGGVAASITVISLYYRRAMTFLRERFGGKKDQREKS